MTIFSNKVILVDVDGVLLDWSFSFDLWMKRHGFTMVDPTAYDINNRYQDLPIDGNWFIKVFNESAWIRKLPPQRDSVKYIKKLHEEHGYIFHAISALSEDEYTQTLRSKNLIDLFGKNVFERFTYIEMGGNKQKHLEFYKDTKCWWIEDHPDNAKQGFDLGLRSLIMKQPYNQDSYHGGIPKVDNWKAIYYHITGSYD